MLNKLVKSIVGDPNERLIGRFREQVAQINALEPALQAATDDALRAKTAAFRARLADGDTLDDLLIEAFALVREASRRTIGLRHFDVQMIGGIVLHQGKIAEARTGEGKTLIASLALYLNALRGKGAHLVTPNDYLSKVGAQQMGAIYHFLGMSVGVIQSGAGNPDAASYRYNPDYPSNDARFQYLEPCRRAEAYACDITYGTNNEFGFDYLRDNMIGEISQLAQRGELQFAIIDEVDNILIDEARTPLIISGPADEPSPLYRQFAGIVKKLKRSSDESVDEKTPDADYVVDEKDRIAYLTENGVRRVEKMLGVTGLYTEDHAEMIPYLDNSLRAMVLFHKDKEYIVQEGQVIIVDEFTGRLMYGRRFSEGLHQAIEAKEGVEVRRQDMTMATITFQNFFRMYKKLAGMTGTALTEAEEFEKIYGLEVVRIPTHRPMIRRDYEDLIFGTVDAKFNAIVQEVQERQANGQPILIGTVAIETSERLSRMLDQAGIKHQVLNAKQHEREAEIITQAGRVGAVTIATNMAGRGVDILLGGNPEGLAREQLRQQGIEVTQVSPEAWEQTLKEVRTQIETDKAKVIEQGGLFVLGTERHEARRIDNQLRGRSGRQGDPGESRFYLSLEDDLMKRFGGDRVKGVMSALNIAADEAIEHSWVSRSIAQAQVRVEGYNFDIRKRVLEYDDIMNKQREVIYRQRRELLQEREMRDDYLSILEDRVGALLDQHAADDPNTVDWDMDAFHRELFAIFPVPESVTPDDLRGLDRDALEERLIEVLSDVYDKREQELGESYLRFAERVVMLNSLDAQWRQHLTDLDGLREGIGLVAIAQRDPLVEYKREAFVMWESMQEQIKARAARTLLNVQPPPPVPAPTLMTPVPVAAMQTANGGQSAPASQPAPAALTAAPPRRVTYQAAPPAAMRVPSPNVGKTNAPNAEPLPPQKAQPMRTERKLGRNDPCWCGSGKKYKDCHMRQDQASRRGQSN